MVDLIVTFAGFDCKPVMFEDVSGAAGVRGWGIGTRVGLGVDVDVGADAGIVQAELLGMHHISPRAWRWVHFQIFFCFFGDWRQRL